MGTVYFAPCVPLLRLEFNCESLAQMLSVLKPNLPPSQAVLIYGVFVVPLFILKMSLGNYSALS